jgi:hypothetical protein
LNFSIGMLGPIVVADFKEYLHPHYRLEELPKGLGGTPVNILTRELLRRGKRLTIFTLDPVVQDEVILEGENLRICIGPFRPKRARDFFSIERAYLLRVIQRERPDTCTPSGHTNTRWLPRRASSPMLLPPTMPR